MTPRTTLAGTCLVFLAVAGAAHAQHDPSTPPAVAAKVALRGEARSIAVREMRIVRRNDVLVAQVDLHNLGRIDRTLFYRFQWIDSIGSQIGDGESWKQLAMLGLGQQTVKSVAPTAAATDFRLEMNVEAR